MAFQITAEMQPEIRWNTHQKAGEYRLQIPFIYRIRLNINTSIQLEIHRRIIQQIEPKKLIGKSDGKPDWMQRWILQQTNHQRIYIYIHVQILLFFYIKKVDRKDRYKR